MKITFSEDAERDGCVYDYLKVGVTYKVTDTTNSITLANGPLKELCDEYLVIGGPHDTEQRVDYEDIGEIEHQ